jgi:hypothetical protein
VSRLGELDAISRARRLKWKRQSSADQVQWAAGLQAKDFFAGFKEYAVFDILMPKLVNGVFIIFPPLREKCIV